MEISDLVFVGTKRCVAAIHKGTGRTIWKTKIPGNLAGQTFVTLCCDGERVYAHTVGRLHCLAARTGRYLWVNELPGMGYRLASICFAGQPAAQSPAAVQETLNQQAAAAFVAATAAHPHA